MLSLVFLGVALFLGLASSTSHATSLGDIHEDVTAALALEAADTAEGAVTGGEAVAAAVDDALLACIVIVLSSLALIGAMTVARGRISGEADDAEGARAVSTRGAPAPSAVSFIELSVIRI